MTRVNYFETAKLVGRGGEIEGFASSQEEATADGMGQGCRLPCYLPSLPCQVQSRPHPLGPFTSEFSGTAVIVVAPALAALLLVSPRAATLCPIIRSAEAFESPRFLELLRAFLDPGVPFPHFHRDSHTILLVFDHTIVKEPLASVIAG